MQNARREAGIRSSTEARGEGKHEPQEKLHGTRRTLCAAVLIPKPSGRSVRAGDEGDLRARQAEIVELAVGQTGELANGLAIAEVGADFGGDHGDEHGGFPCEYSGPGRRPQR